MHNVLVGFDNSRGSVVAVQQALEMAEQTAARVHLLEAVEPVGPAHIVQLASSDDPLAILDRTEALMHSEDPTLPEDEDSGQQARRVCEDSGVVCSFQRLHGMAAQVLREQSVAMDLVVVGRHGTSHRRSLGSTAARLLRQPLAPTLLCRDEVVPWRRVLLGYVPSAAGGRALKLAGELSSALNASLDVVVADHKRDRARRKLEYVRRALRAFHVEGEFIPYAGTLTDGLRQAALDLHSSVVVVPRTRPCLAFWLSPLSLAQDMGFTGAMTLVVP